MLQFWRDEYPLNAAIKNYRKPYVALIDGMVMGGGVGVSVHGSHRVAGDRFQFAMPEVGIGFFPDVGATWFLPRMPGELGTYCGLTGERFDAADAARRGHCDPSHALGALSGAARRPDRHGLGRCGAGRLRGTGGRGTDRGAPRQHRPAVRRRQRRGHPRWARPRSGRRVAEPWAAKPPPPCATKSPLSLKIALAQVRRGQIWDFETCMRAEFRIVSRVIHDHDFYEGVRAVIVDKDNKPRWQPATLRRRQRRPRSSAISPRCDGDELVLP